MICESNYITVSKRCFGPHTVLHDDIAHLKGCRNHGLTGNNGSENRDDQAGIEHAGRNGVEEWIGEGTRILANVCRLTNVL